MTEKGFTLIELLIALSVIAIMISLLSAALFFSSRAWDRVESYTERNTTIGAVWYFLDQQFRQAVSTRMIIKGHKKPYFFFQGEKYQVEWLAPMPAYLGSGGLYILKLNLNQGHLFLTRWLFHPDILSGQSKEIPRWQPQQGFQLSQSDHQKDMRAWYSQTILADIQSIRFRYYGKDKLKDPPSWRTEWHHDYFLPRLIAIQIEDQKGAWPEMVFQLPDN